MIFQVGDEYGMVKNTRTTSVTVKKGGRTTTSKPWGKSIKVRWFIIRYSVRTDSKKRRSQHAY